MINNFDSLKEQLNQLAPIINGFKSEAVQLRIVEIIFAQATDRPTTPLEKVASPQSTRKVKRARTSTKTGDESATDRKAQQKSGGFTTTLEHLLSSGYFKQPRLIGDIAKHCKESLATSYPNTTIAVYLNRATRSGKLNRAKDQNGQYQYSKP